jgi:hypothetical protein
MEQSSYSEPEPSTYSHNLGIFPRGILYVDGTSSDIFTISRSVPEINKNISYIVRVSELICSYKPQQLTVTVYCAT